LLKNIFFILLLFPAALCAQQAECIYTLSGQVIDDHDRSPLSFATITVKEANKSAIGDSLGFYIIKGLCKGEYSVVCNHIGCDPMEMKVKIKDNTIQNFYPEHHEEELQNVEVKSFREEKTTAGSDKMNAKALEENAGNSFSESVATITGVNLLQTGPTIAKPVIHGLHSNRILIIQNGIRQEDQQWGAEHAPELDPFAASKITVIKGAGVVRYGSDAIGGIILSEPSPLPHEAGIAGSLSSVGMTNGLGGTLSSQLQGGMKKWKGFGWRAQGTMKRAGDAHAPDYHLSNTGMREFGTTASLGLKRKKTDLELYYSFFYNELAILRASHTGNLTDLENAINSAEPWYIEDFTFEIQNPRQVAAHHLVKAKTVFHLKNAWKFETQYGFQFNSRQEFDIRRGGRSSIPAIDLQLQTHTLDVVAEKTGSKNFHTIFGAAGFFQDNYNVPGTGIRPLIPDYKTGSAGIFFIERYVRAKWEAELGARYDFRLLNTQKIASDNSLYEKQLAYHNFSGTAGAVARFLEYFSLRTNAGVSFRPPSVNELFSEGLHHGAAAIEEGDENLITEKGIKLVTSIEYTRSAVAEFKLLGYYNQIFNYIYLQPQDELRLTIRGAFPVFNYVQTDARLTGFDFSAKMKTVSNLFLQSKISFISAYDVAQDDYLFGIPSNRFENNISYERERWGKLADVDFSFGVLNVLEQKRVPAGDFAPPPSAYFLLQVAAGFKIPMAKNHKLGLQVAVENLLDKSYRDYMNRFRYYADDAGRNFILRVHYSF